MNSFHSSVKIISQPQREGSSTSQARGVVRLRELWNLVLIKWKMLWGKQALCFCCSEHITLNREAASGKCGEGMQGCE